MEAVLERIDSLVTLSVFASLAGLSLATTTLVAQLQMGVNDVERALSLVVTKKSLNNAFRLFVLGLATTLGFDGILSADVPAAVDAGDVLATGGPLVAGVGLLYHASREFTK